MNILLLLSFLSIEQNCFDQFLNDASKGSFIYSSTIDRQLYSCVFHEELSTTSVGGVSSLGILNQDQNITVLLQFTRPWGGFYAYYLLVTFDKSGTIISSSDIAHSEVEEHGEGISSGFKLYYDSIMEISVEYSILNEQTNDQKVIKTEYKYYKIDKSGFFPIEVVLKSKGRLYPKASIKIIESRELSGFQQRDLDIMRNEIFADHGYRFKTEEWQNYFAKQSWYKPRFDDVNDYLSVIEKVNIQTILEVSRLKEK